MRLIYTPTGLNNPYSCVLTNSGRESDLRTIPISMDTSEDRVSKMGSGAKVVAISNRLDGGLFKSLETLEPSTKLNGSVLQGLISPVHPAWLVIRRWLWTQTSILLHSSISCRVGASGYATGQSGYRNPGKHTSWRRHSYNVSRFIPDFLNGGSRPIWHLPQQYRAIFILRCSYVL